MVKRFITSKTIVIGFLVGLHCLEPNPLQDQAIDVWRDVRVAASEATGCVHVNGKNHAANSLAKSLANDKWLKNTKASSFGATRPALRPLL